MQKSLSLLLLALTATALWLAFPTLTPPASPFKEYQQTYGKVYSQAEINFREAIFTANLRLILAHNADPASTYEMGVNRFTDLSQDEFAALYLNFVLPPNHPKAVSELPPLGVNVDWAAAGKVSGIKDQGQCGSSWAFGATGAIESAYMIKGTNILVSEQEIMDCSTDYGNQGCNGGYMSAALKFVKERKVHEEKDYPYLAKFQKCLKPSGTTWGLTNYVDVVGCSNLINAVTIGPVAIAVDATTFSTYKSGILGKCGNTANHGSLVVGVTDTYWKLQEAWGVNWGEKGFIRIPPGNSCAVCDIPSYPIV